MKKITLILSLMVAMVTTAMAQVASLDEITDEKVFTIESARAFLMYNADIKADGIISTTGKKTTADLKIKNSANTGQQFQIKTVNGQRYLYSVAANKYLAEGNTLTENPTNALTIKETGNATYKWYLQVGNHGLNSQESNQTDEGIMVNGWTEEDPGNRYRLLDVNEVYDFTVASLSQFDMGKAYTATTPKRGAWTVKDDLSAFASTTDANQTVDATNNKQHFAIVSQDGIDYYLYSIAAQKFVNHDKTLSEKAYEPIEVSAGSGNYAGRLRVNFKGISSSYINHGGDHQMTIDNWGTIDDGNAIEFLEVATFDPIEALSNLPIEATYTVTDQFGNVYNGDFKYYGIDSFTLPGVYGCTFDNVVWDAENCHYTATFNFPFPVSKIDGATNETLLKLKSQDRYIRYTEGSDVYVSDGAVDANCYWAVYPSFNDGTFTFTIMNTATGKYLYSEATQGDHNQGAVVLSETPTEFTYVNNLNRNTGFSGFKIKDKDLVLSINSPGTNAYLGVNGYTHAGSDYVSAKINEYNVTITDAKYATFYAPVAVTVPEGVTAHTVTVNGDWATLSEALPVIPAYTGVVLYSETPETYTFAVTEEQVAAVENNTLDGTVAATYVTEDAYVLGIVGSEVGFYTATKNQKDETAFLNNSHKAYLPKTTSMNSASLRFDFGGTTAIEEITEQRAEGKVIFDLTGRRVNEITKAGVYIVNGKKVLVK